MNIPAPNFISFPNPETMLIIRVVSLIAGVCIIGVGLILLFLRKRKDKKTTAAWILICVGVLLLATQGIQLLIGI